MNVTVKILVFLCINLIICALVTSGHVLVRNQTFIVKIHSVSLQNFVCHRFNPSILYMVHTCLTYWGRTNRETQTILSLASLFVFAIDVFKTRKVLVIYSGIYKYTKVVGEQLHMKHLRNTHMDVEKSRADQYLFSFDLVGYV